ncbi:translocation/assembly module TamB domain-containing protein [Methylocucumis oryzae]|uniref:Uncharacterized protein n=1 Tax=Methylocucumis oryzae TaxID=1632867 RepID=A0A0F3IH85_9GAMM|nr:hypothetical protein [Methylocucumis oryzae]KJV06145.1 hypothetical protein VZ94_13155 [Methylocucumis oryzae]
MKWLKTVIVLLLLVLIPLAVVVGVIASERGCRWVLNHVPGLTITAMHGTLLSQITLTGLRYENPDLSLSADSIHLAWQAPALLTRTLAIDAFTSQKLIIAPHPTKPAPPSTFTWQQGIQLPVSIQLKHVQLDDTQLINDGTVLTLKQVNLALQSQNNHIVLQKLSVNLPDIDTKLTGELDLSAGFPMQLQGDWRFTHAVGTWQGQLQVIGDINRLTLQHELKQPFAIQSKAEFSEILATPTIKSVSTWQQQLRWPLTGATPQLQSQQGRLEVNGTLNAYQVNASAQLASPNVKQALVTLQGQGSLTSFSFKPLQLTTADGQCQFSGEVSWQNFLAFNLALSAKAFNLALLVPDFPSQLTLSSQLRGQYQKDWQASLQIHNIDGTLRGQPITAQGLVEYQHEQLTIKPLTIKIGRNQLKSEGMLSQQQANLTVNADMPDLSVLWPGLAGKINGETTLKGRWPMPDVNAQLSGLDLRLQQYQIKNLALVVDFKPENPNSRIELKADAIHSNTLDIATAHINVSGDINKQQAQSQINTNYGQLSLALSGQWRKPTWSGQVTELSLTATRAGDWHAQVPVLLTAQPLAKALAVELAPLCLSQTAARVCVAGRFIDAQRITASFTSQGLPLALLNPVLPHHAVAFNNSILNSDVQLKSDASSGWSGQYQFTVPSSTITLTGAKQPTTLALGELAVKGVLARQQLKTELAFSYEGNNQLTGTVNLGLTAPQALSGQINAKLNSYQLLNAFLPDASITSGLLTANIALAGQLAKPTFTGQLTWHDGTVNSANIGLTDIQIDAIAEQTQHLKLTATAKPFLPTASGLDKTFFVAV